MNEIERFVPCVARDKTGERLAVGDKVEVETDTFGCYDIGEIVSVHPFSPVYKRDLDGKEIACRAGAFRIIKKNLLRFY